MITKFKHFLNETAGYPDPIKPYAELILEKCMIDVDKYFFTCSIVHFSSDSGAEPS